MDFDETLTALLGMVGRWVDVTAMARPALDGAAGPRLARPYSMPSEYRR
jgi:hypothetical protein